MNYYDRLTDLILEKRLIEAGVMSGGTRAILAALRKLRSIQTTRGRTGARLLSPRSSMSKDITKKYGRVMRALPVVPGAGPSTTYHPGAGTTSTTNPKVMRVMRRAARLTSSPRL